MPKFLCDQMCANLGRWLRTAGYDTTIAESGESDRNILEQAIKENRILLTRDSHFLKMDSYRKNIRYLEGKFLEDWVSQLSSGGVNWLNAPFSRCLKCNSLLESKKDSQLSKKIEGITEFWFCPTCQQLFWRGSHTARMLDTLTLWQNHYS